MKVKAYNLNPKREIKSQQLDDLSNGLSRIVVWSSLIEDLAGQEVEIGDDEERRDPAMMALARAIKQDAERLENDVEAIQEQPPVDPVIEVDDGKK